GLLSNPRCGRLTALGVLPQRRGGFPSTRKSGFFQKRPGRPDAMFRRGAVFRHAGGFKSYQKLPPYLRKFLAHPWAIGGRLGTVCAFDPCSASFIDTLKEDPCSRNLSCFSPSRCWRVLSASSTRRLKW